MLEKSVSWTENISNDILADVNQQYDQNEKKNVNRTFNSNIVLGRLQKSKVEQELKQNEEGSPITPRLRNE